MPRYFPAFGAKDRVEGTSPEGGDPHIMKNMVGLFFVVNGRISMHECSHEDAVPYGDFLNYPYSHDAVWNREYEAKYRVSFDFYPRGRIIHNMKDGRTLIYHDRCVSELAKELARDYENPLLCLDEHYQCAGCNPDYVLI